MTAEAFGTGDAITVVAAVLLLILALVLVAAEEALERFSQVRAESLLDDEPKRAGRLVRLLGAPVATRNPLRLIIMSAQLVQSALVALLASRFLTTPWLVLAVAANTIVAFVLAETVPRTMAILHAERVALWSARPVDLLLRLAPVRYLARALIWLTNGLVPGGGLRTGPFALPAELIAFADAAVEDEVIEQNERDLIESVIEFGATIVREVMVPRTDMTTVERDVSVEDALEMASSAGYSRFPVLGENVDDVVGLVFVKDLIRAELDGRPDQSIRSMLRPAWFVPETKKAAELLQEMQDEKSHMAVAVDEYGGIAGLVTLEDLIEELVGEIVDEYDVEEPMLDPLRDGTYRVDARMPIDEFNDAMDIELPEGDWDTVGGLVFDLFGRVPSRGEECDVEGHRLRVDQIHGRRIKKVVVVPRRPVETVEQP